jgi:hypothetical protein
MNRRCLTIALGIALLAPCALREALAGPHANGVLLPHLNPSIEYTSTMPSYEGMSGLQDCREAIVQGRVDAERAQVWFVMASFAYSPGPVELATAAFGFGAYNRSRIEIVAYGACNDGYLEMPTDGWPGPNEGTAILFFVPDNVQRSEVVELYWFASYAYAAVEIPLGPRPEAPPPNPQFTTPAVNNSAIEDEASDFGVIGFGMEGYNPCGFVVADGACCVFSECLILRREECEAREGVYQGDNTDCFPNPCGKPIETTWGVLKGFYQ